MNSSVLDLEILLSDTKYFLFVCFRFCFCLFCFICFSKWTTQERNRKCCCPFTFVRRLLLAYVESLESKDLTTKTTELRCWICFLSIPVFCFPQAVFGSWLRHLPQCVRNHWIFASLYFFICNMGTKKWIYYIASLRGFITCESWITVLARGRCLVKSFLSSLLPSPHSLLQLMDIYTWSLESKCPW